LVEQLLREARRRRGLPPPPIQPPRPVADVESPDFQRGREAYRAYQWIDRALAEGFRRTARKYALRLLAERPLKLRNWRILCKTLSWLPDGRPRRAA
jgi:hypothetical protein